MYCTWGSIENLQCVWNASRSSQNLLYYSQHFVEGLCEGSMNVFSHWPGFPHSYEAYDYRCSTCVHESLGEQTLIWNTHTRAHTHTHTCKNTQALRPYEPLCTCMLLYMHLWVYLLWLSYKSHQWLFSIPPKKEKGVWGENQPTMIVALNVNAHKTANAFKGS